MQDIAKHQLRDIGIGLNIYYDDMGLFYLKLSKSQLFGYVDASYLSYHHKAYLKWGMYFLMVIRQYHGDQSSK